MIVREIGEVYGTVTRSVSPIGYVEPGGMMRKSEPALSV